MPIPFFMIKNPCCFSIQKTCTAVNCHLPNPFLLKDTPSY
ncbi:hypothetical protein B4096_2127 [Heyndrickxia coagulans]|nr:hypothetical protein B4096_2127 [Heyndrickxia coagulans]